MMNRSTTAPNVLSMPALIQRTRWIADPIGYMQAASQEYPDLFTADVAGFGGTFLFANTPEAMQEILTNDRKTYAALGDWNRILSPLIGDYSVIMLDGDRHRKRRQLVIPPFHGDRMKAYGNLMIKLAQETFGKLPYNEPFLARNAMQEISLQVILQAVFGVYEGDRAQQLKQKLAALADVFRSPLSSSLLFFKVLQQDWGRWSPWGKFLRDRQELDDLIYAEIRDRREQPDSSRIDILSMLMAATDEMGQPMTDQELRDELMTLMFAGHETTATAMSWALYWVHHLLEVRDKLLHELHNSDPSDPLSVFRLPYLTAVCNETLRIHPVAMLTFPRVVQEPTELLGYNLEPGTGVCGCMYLIHQREDLYPEPQKFKPDRFLERQYTPYEFIPFGNGARRCIGEAFAQFEMKLVLSTVLQTFTLALADAQPEYPRRRGVTLAPARGVKMVKLEQR
jgi:unspecific monooxygenase